MTPDEADARLNNLLLMLSVTPYDDYARRNALVTEMERVNALAAAARQGGDVQQAPAESPQSGPAKQGNAQKAGQ